MRHEPLDIDSDVRKARTPPAWFYRSERVHGWLIDHLFARSWQIVAPMSRLQSLLAERAQPGAWPFVFLPGCVDEPLVLTRDGHGVVHCLSNVCTRRAATLVDAPGEVDSLRCPAHGCSFALDGRMLDSPELADADGPPGSGDDLPSLPLVGFGELLWTAIDPAWPFAELVEQLIEFTAALPWTEARPEPAGAREVEVAANWMLYCERALGPDPTRPLALDRYGIRLGQFASVQFELADEGAPSLPMPIDAPPDLRAPARMSLFLFPNTIIHVHRWGVALERIEPLDVARTRVRHEAWAWAPDRYAAPPADDHALVLRAQAGVASRLFERGRYSATRELAVHHFHWLLARGWNGH